MFSNNVWDTIDYHCIKNNYYFLIWSFNEVFLRHKYMQCYYSPPTIHPHATYLNRHYLLTYVSRSASNNITKHFIKIFDPKPLFLCNLRMLIVGTMCISSFQMQTFTVIVTVIFLSPVTKIAHWSLWSISRHDWLHETDSNGRVILPGKAVTDGCSLTILLRSYHRHSVTQTEITLSVSRVTLTAPSFTHQH